MPSVALVSKQDRPRLKSMARSASATSMGAVRSASDSDSPVDFSTQ